jgi:hypothetical protein
MPEFVLARLCMAQAAMTCRMGADVTSTLVCTCCSMLQAGAPQATSCCTLFALPCCPSSNCDSVLCHILASDATAGGPAPCTTAVHRAGCQRYLEVCMCSGASERKVALATINAVASEVPELDPGSRLSLQPTTTEHAARVVGSLVSVLGGAKSSEDHRGAAAKALASWMKVTPIASETSLMGPGLTRGHLHCGRSASAHNLGVCLSKLIHMIRCPPSKRCCLQRSTSTSCSSAMFVQGSLRACVLKACPLC